MTSEDMVLFELPPRYRELQDEARTPGSRSATWSSGLTSPGPSIPTYESAFARAG